MPCTSQLSPPPPCSSYVPSPETFLHRVDARVKQVRGAGWEALL